MSLFITFEGGEGCGKSLQARTLYKKLSQLAIPVLLTHEPGGTPLGNRIRHTVKRAKTEISPLTELMLFNASRAQLVNDVIRPALKRGEVVVCDRFADSTVVYQSYGRGLDAALVKRVNDAATGGLKPNLTLLLDVPAEIGLARKKGSPDRFEQESIDFHRRVRDGFLKMAAAEPHRWLVIDATQSKTKIATTVWQKVSQLLSEKS